jgi:hypothetical protein
MLAVLGRTRPECVGGSMTDCPRKYASNTRGRPFAAGNPGKPKGARHRATVAAEALLDGEAEALTRKAIELALAGDVIALRLCLERILPPRRERPMEFSLPTLRSPADLAAAMAALAGAAAAGEIMLGEAAEFAKLLETYTRALETTEFEWRLRALEARDETRS